MNIEQIALILECEADLKDLAFSEGCTSGEYVGLAMRQAAALLRTHPDNQPNEELTEEDLRGMVGKWVWATVHYSHCDTSGWAFVCTRGRLAYFDQMLDINGCGTKFVARRRPPEEGQR